MKIFGFHILRQKTLNKGITEACIKARKEAIVMPNKVISKLLWQIHGKHRESLMEAYQKSRKSRLRSF